jgi:TIR domain
MNSTTTEKPKVFISYSHGDSSDFAKELVEGLKLGGFAPFLDSEDIAYGEDWEKRLDVLIQKADTVVFVVSPEAIKSEGWNQEVNKTVELSKRRLPVIFIAVSDAEIPQKLRQLQYIHFDGVERMRALNQLKDALLLDIKWIRYHTHIGERAADWQARPSESLLLRGDDLDAARAWSANRKPDAPEITDLQQRYIEASESSEEASKSRELRVRRRGKLLTNIAVVSGIIILMLGSLAIYHEFREGNAAAAMASPLLEPKPPTPP